jgi:predicted aldo/keto reductase-like oxidoreductase
MADVPTRLLGSTGERVSAVGLGGWHLALPHVSESLADRIMRTCLDRGITFFDNCWDYNRGASERRMGTTLKGALRQKVFLMTKIDGRSGREATRQLNESLRRLKTDCIDLVQHHEVLRFEDPNRMFDEGGANAALVKARKAGKLRYIGFTGHKDPQIHLHTIAVGEAHGFSFDAVQMPLNVMDAHYRSFERIVLPDLVAKRIGVLGMKPIANGIILKSRTVSAVECLRYALTLPTSVVITGIDSMKVLDQACEVASSGPLNEREVSALLARTAAAGSRGEFEPFKTTSLFDGTADRIEWMGEESKRAQKIFKRAPGFVQG